MKMIKGIIAGMFSLLLSGATWAADGCIECHQKISPG